MRVCSQLSVDDLYSLLSLEAKDSMATLWTVAIDDSGDERKEVLIIAGCLVGDKSAWKTFNKAWRKQLHLAPRIEYFHQKEYSARDGEFRQFYDRVNWPKPTGKDAAKQKRDDLLLSIGQSPLNCYALALRVSDYNRVRNESDRAKRFLDKDPWSFLIQELAFDTSTKIVEFDPQANVAFLAGPHEKKAQYEEFYNGFKKKNPVIADHMRSMTHGDFRNMYSLQAADLIASESKRSWEAAERKESAEQVFSRHPILAKFVGFNTIHEDRLRGVVEKQGTKPPLKRQGEKRR
jgi:hypothetical protein